MSSNPPRNTRDRLEAAATIAVCLPVLALFTYVLACWFGLR